MIFLPPEINQIYHSIQILLGPILNFEWRTLLIFTWSAPPGGKFEQTENLVWVCEMVRDFLYVVMAVGWNLTASQKPCKAISQLEIACVVHTE